MDYRLTDDDKERIKLLEEVSKNKFKCKTKFIWVSNFYA